MQAKKSSRQCKLISFSGIDGSGKSTQIGALCTRLEEAGQQVLIISFWNDVARLTRFREAAGHTLFRGDLGVGTPEAPIHRRDKNVRSWAMTVVRLFLYSIDALSLRRALQRAFRSGADVLIADRYIYDELANLDLRNPANRFYISWVLKIVPKPSLSFLLDADPVEARLRKPEYPLDFLRTNRNSYLALSNLAQMTVIDPMTTLAAEQTVWEYAKGLQFAASASYERRSIAEKDETASRPPEKAGAHDAAR